MAKSGDTPSEAAAPAKKGKGLLLLIVVAVLMLLVGGGGAWFFLSHKKGEHTAEAKPVKKATPVFMTLEPFVVNLAGDVQHYLQVGIDLRVADSSVPDQIKVHLPEIRNGVLLLLSSKKVEDLVSVEQKNQLRNEIREVVNQPLGISTPAPKAAGAEGIGEAHASDGTAAASHAAADAANQSGVLEVLLTSFVIQ